MQKPFLRWAGGKRHSVPYLLKEIPASFKAYWEPFLGSAALFFAIKPNKSYLSDLNYWLIECYKYVKSQPELVNNYLLQHTKNSSKEYYYRTREIFNESKSSAAQAARFIFLNRTSFNGIFRVNMQGKYNVPYGFKEPPPMPSFEEIIQASKCLENSILQVQDFEKLLSNNDMKAGDFCYIDPPYPPLNGANSHFNHYTDSRFNWDDQARVAFLADKLNKKNCLVMISNIDHPKIRGLYEKWNIAILPVTRLIAANGSRHRVNELIIKNY